MFTLTLLPSKRNRKAANPDVFFPRRNVSVHLQAASRLPLQPHLLSQRYASGPVELVLRVQASEGHSAGRQAWALWLCQCGKIISLLQVWLVITWQAFHTRASLCTRGKSSSCAGTLHNNQVHSTIFCQGKDEWCAVFLALAGEKRDWWRRKGKDDSQLSLTAHNTRKDSEILWIKGATLRPICLIS